MREKVLQYIREKGLLRAGDRVAVAVSGGADSVALLRLLLELRGELGIVLAVAHFNHGLREQAGADEAFVAEIAKKHRLEFFAGRADVRDHALTSKLSIEAAGRELRYRWFSLLAEEQRLNAIATAHTLDDQAETVLLKFLRGAGTRGLAGIYPVVRLETSWAKARVLGKQGYGTPEGVPLQSVGLPSAEADSTRQEEPLDACLKASSASIPEAEMPDADRESSSAERPICKVVRPLLCVSRQEVEAYLSSVAQEWREDESNLDRRFLRNRVRHELLPLLEREFNPNVRRVLSDVAEIARGEEEFWQHRVERELRARGIAASAPKLKPDVREARNAGLKARTSTRQAGSSLSDSEPAASAEVAENFLRDPNAGVDTEADAAVAAPDRLDLNGFGELPIALQRRVLKRFADRQGITLDFEHVERLRRYALGEGSKIELPGGRIAQVVDRSLNLRLPPRCEERISYRYLLPIPGETHIAELNLTLRAEIVPPEFAQEMAPGELLSLDLLMPELTVRNWLPGDRFWPSLSRSQEKLKRLFAEKRIPASQRPTWPVVVCGEEIVWVQGFPVGNLHRWKGDGTALRLEVIPYD